MIYYVQNRVEVLSSYPISFKNLTLAQGFSPAEPVNIIYLNL